MEFMDLSVALAAKEAADSEDKFENPEIFWINGMLPETSRYLFCKTISQAIGIWDLYNRRCVRIIDTGLVTLTLCTVKSLL